MRPKNTSSSSIPAKIAFTACPAKTFQTTDGFVVPGRTVAGHCEIVGHTAQALIARYPAALRSELFPANAAFAAACHDIGKVSPCFFEKLRRACTVSPQGWAKALPWTVFLCRGKAKQKGEKAVQGGEVPKRHAAPAVPPSPSWEGSPWEVSPPLVAQQTAPPAAPLGA